MFRLDAPRVQNRRDPQFASLVQSAIATSEVCSQILATAASAPYPALDAGFGEYETVTTDLPSADPTAQLNSLGAPDWPPLRLVATSDRPTVEADADEFDRPNRWNCDDSLRWNDAASSLTAEDDDPILVVEDDDPSTRSPVRRVEYRNLFSRLRGE
jgi:hypothetical protein